MGSQPAGTYAPPTLEKLLSAGSMLVAAYARERALRSVDGLVNSEDLLHAVRSVLRGVPNVDSLVEALGLTMTAIEQVIGIADGALKSEHANWSDSAKKAWLKASDIAFSYGREFRLIEPEYVLYALVLEARDDPNSGVARVILQAAPGLDLAQLLKTLDDMSAGMNRHEPIYTRPEATEPPVAE